ncbi:fungal-specific transcription factor domain-containing protein [Scleroderma citrinum]
MSSQEEDYNDSVPHNALPESKKRRVQRACDICRRKKSDGSQMPGNRCSNCIAYNFECTYMEAARKRGPPKGYVEGLENRLEKMEKLLQKVCPDADFSQELGGGRIDRDSWFKGSPLSQLSNTPSTLPGVSHSMEDFVADDDDSIASTLGENLFSLTLQPGVSRYFGKSSGPMLVQKAIHLKKEYSGDEIVASQRPSYTVRPEFQSCNPWEVEAMKMSDPGFTFPDEDFGLTLINLYFVHLNPLYPLLHRPTFEHKVKEGHHLRDHGFGSVYLLVCANGARYSDDPRVFLDGATLHSAGWKYFEQVPVIGKTLLAPPTLEDLQVYCLSSLYLQGTSAPQACWTIVGVGIRFAQDVGAHRRKVYNSTLTVEGELWKRAFWVLVTLDRSTSVSLGRPCAIQEEDFDIDLPVECDDEYWEQPDPELTFKQPENKPCSISFFVSYLKLFHIQAFALRTLYSISKHKAVFGYSGPQWEERVVAELDSALNKWIDAVPDHLRWDPHKDVNTPFFTQSCVLYASYYQLQILIHRPFIPSPRRPSLLSFPSLAICTNAARSCSHILDVYNKRRGVPIPCIQMPAFTAGIVLLLNIWGGKRSGLSTDPAKEMVDVHKCMAFLKLCEKRWHIAGRLWDILYELASVGDLPPPQPSPTGGVKRDRDSDGGSPCSTLVSFSPSPTQSHDGPRAIAGSRRVHRGGSPSSRQYPSPVTNLPVYSDDLGRLPIHGQVNLSVPTGLDPSSSTAGVWYPSHHHDHPNMHTQAHQHQHHHHAGEGHSSTHLGNISSGVGLPYLPTVPSHTHPSPSAYPVGEHVFNGTNGGFEYSSAHHTPSPPATAFFGTGEGNHEFHVSVDASGVHHPHPHPHPHPPSHSHAHHHAPVPVPTHVPTPAPSMLDHSVGGGHGHTHLVDNDTMTMWSKAPSGFEIGDWGMYITNVSGV